VRQGARKLLRIELMLVSMTTHPNDKPPRPVLHDHRRIGKRFIPPFIAALGSLHEIRWVDEVLPEVVWLDLLNSQYGLREGAELAIRMPKALHQKDATATQWFAFTSDYENLSAQDWADLIAALGEPVVNRLKAALRPLVALYPRAPFSHLWPGGEIPKTDDDLGIIREAVDRLLDRGDVPATFAQANAIYVGFAVNKLVVNKGLALANFPAIQHYPDTDESKAIASAVRAMVTGMVGHLREPSAEVRPWPAYFWRRGLELSPCELPEAL